MGADNGSAPALRRGRDGPARSTNADRTAHLSEKASEPPGAARPDVDVFVDFATRLGLQDKDGGPLVPWRAPLARSRRGRSAVAAARATTRA